MRIDAHINVTKSGEWGDTSYSASLDRLEKELDESEIDKAVLIPIKGLADESYVVDVINQLPERYMGFGTIGASTYESDLKFVKNNGLLGVKFHPRIQAETLEDMDKSGALVALEESNIPLMICGWMQSKTVAIEHITPLKVDLIAKKHPKLKIILTHLGCHRYWDAFFVARSNPNVFLDCSYFLKVFKGTSLEGDFFNSVHLIDQKVIFGSDFPEVNIKAYLDELLLGLERNGKVDIEKVLSQNFKRLIYE